MAGYRFLMRYYDPVSNSIVMEKKVVAVFLTQRTRRATKSTCLDLAAAPLQPSS